LSPVKTTFKSYPNFSFDDNSKRFYSERKMAYKGKLDNNGYARMNIDLGDLKNAPGAVKAMFYGKVYEEGGDFSISNTNIPYYPYSSFVGIKVPEGDKRGIILTDEDHEVRIATVDVDGNPVSRSNVKVELFKLNWRWWWDKSYDDISNYVGRSYRDPILTKRISTSNGEGAWKLRIDYPSWGRYFVRVTDPVSEHSAGAVVYIDWPGWAGKGKRGDLDGAAMLDFGVEKESYKVGEKVALSIPSTAGNRLLVSLESGSEVLQTFWVESEKDNTVISFEATEDMSPNVYAHLTMIQPHAQTANDLPIRLYGVQSIEVVDPQTVLKPNINMPKELKPEQDYTISISEENGKAMSYTVAIVDEGLLDITNYKTPDPWSSFYAREALGIKTWDVFDDVMGAFTAQMDRLLAIGGDGELEIKDQKEANRFKPVVRFLGPFELEAGNTNKHKIKMPQYIGSVKTMVIAANNGAYGAADKTTPVKQPLMTLATLPRVAGPGETMKLPVTVFTMDDAIKNVQVSVEATGTLQLASSKSKNVTFSKSGDKVIYFDLKVKEYLGYGSVKVTAKSGQMVAEYDIEMNVIPRNPLATMVDDKVVNSNETWQINYKPVGISSENTGYIELSTLPPLNIEQRLGFLIRYPHGCVEQTTSSVFPQLFLADLVKLDSKAEARVQNNVEAGIKKLKKFQLSNGGFAYWPGYDYANNWGTNYAGHFLLEAKKAGYAVPENMVSSWINYQKSKAESWGTMSSDDDNDLIQSYRLYTLALADNASLGAMNRMKEKTSLRIEAKWRLALAYAHAGYENQALELIDGLSATIADENSKYYRYSYGSRTRDQAMILETLLSLDKKEDAFTLLMDIAEQMSETNRWMSTQTTAYCFIAIAKYADEFELGTGTNVSIDIAGETKSVTGNEFVSQVQLADSDKESAISITNNAEAPVFARLIRTGIPIEGGEEETRRNINMTVQYQDLNGKFIGVDQLEQGTNFKAIITIANPGLKGNYTDLALTQIFPSGWEIINTRLDGSVDKLNVDYMDIRDDRTMHYFDLSPYKNKTITVLLNAAYQGKYYLPSVSVEAMYDNSIFANKTGKWVSVVPEE
ncbi:MAG: alpha-2-macroglobulin family protein, partial [Bacteroidota bacterium]